MCSGGAHWLEGMGTVRLDARKLIRGTTEVVQIEDHNANRMRNDISVVRN